ncbi:hypothetical protein GDO78_003182 [Eleutherodactylus coqui]|uniref:TBC1 domain-containing protein n=1 Tax=Eleutherodactylus coqui TaxID=57060 RepID=A0A8J6K1V8_ELECQ|nr:hypothetical protein GDO78_003182 [Eleutherodactylus coqui]
MARNLLHTVEGQKPRSSYDNELVLKEPGVNTIQVNKRTRKHEAFTDQIPAKEVTLELSDKNYPQDRNGTWHAHLNLHCIMHLYDQPASETNPSEHDGDINKNVLFERLLCSEHQPINVPEPNTVIMEMNGDHQSIRSLHRKSSLKNPIPSSWNQPPFPNCKSASTEKLLYYPFPQKKNPRISEAARKLGLYVTH